MFKKARRMFLCSRSSPRMDFSISKTWDNAPTDHEPVIISLSSDDAEYVTMKIYAPFFNDPPAPTGDPGKPFPKLWDYEVVEAFFLGADEKYLEVEFSPHGQHLLLLLAGRGNAIKMCLPVRYTATIEDRSWIGVAQIPSAYFPPAVHLFNAYAIHGSDDDRVYEALYPVPSGHFTHPNFHRLEYFKHIEFSKYLRINPSATFSNIWTEALQHKDDPLVCS